MWFLRCAIGCVFLLWILGASVWAQGEVEADWEKGIVKAVSHGFAREGLGGMRANMMAQRAARVMALRDMAEFIGGIHVSSETTVEDAMLSGDVISARVNSVIKQAYQVGKTQYDANGMATVGVDVETLGVDMLSVAGHKLYAPKGVGALYVRDGVALEKIMHGAGHEGGRRAGTENVLEIVGLGKACELIAQDLDAHILHMRTMRDRLEKQVMSQLSDVQVNGDLDNRLPNTLSISFRCACRDAS